MRTFFTSVCLILCGILLLSFSKGGDSKITKSDIVGFWVVENPSALSISSGMKVFEKNGRFYNVAIENGETIMTHKGKYKLLDGGHYREEVTNVRFNSKWDLKDKAFINYYELSKDKKSLLLGGVVFSKDGTDSLRWSHKYKKVEIPE
jgi:hypothetical protein